MASESDTGEKWDDIKTNNSERAEPISENESVPSYSDKIKRDCSKFTWQQEMIIYWKVKVFNICSDVWGFTKLYSLYGEDVNLVLFDKLFRQVFHKNIILLWIYSEYQLILRKGQWGLLKTQIFLKVPFGYLWPKYYL